MAATRRNYDKQFKLMVVELSKSREDYTKMAEELDIRPELIYRWKREASQEQEAFTGNGNPRYSEHEAEIARLNKRLKDVEMERDILKKAVSIFSKSDGKYS